MDFSSIEPALFSSEAVQLEENSSCGRDNRLLKIDFEWRVINSPASDEFAMSIKEI
jgi:hypothetical protein